MATRLAESEAKVGSDFLDFSVYEPLAQVLGHTAVDAINGHEISPLWSSIVRPDADAFNHFNQKVLSSLSEGEEAKVLIIGGDHAIETDFKVRNFLNTERGYNYNLTTFNIVLLAALAGHNAVSRTDLYKYGGVPLEDAGSALKNLQRDRIITSWAPEDKRAKKVYGLPAKTFILDRRLEAYEEQYYVYCDWFSYDNAEEDMRDDIADMPSLPWSYEEDQANPHKRICEYLLGFRQHISSEELEQNSSKLPVLIKVVDVGMADWWTCEQALFSQRKARLLDIRKQNI